jgi:proteasome accessory factor C
MAKSISAPLARTARLLDLVPYLNTHQGISLKDLAQKFDVSTAQMSSDLTTLWMCGLPGYTPLELMDLEFESGFVTIRNAATLARPRSISFDEGVALILGLDLLVSSIPEERKDLLGSINSLKKKIAEKVGVTGSLVAKPKASVVLISKISEAISKSTFLDVSYHSLYRDEVTQRTIQPLEIVNQEDEQYLRAYCFRAGAMRDFRVDRMLQAEINPNKPVTHSNASNSQPIDFVISLMSPSRDVVERFDIDYTDSSEAHQLTSYSQQWIERSVLASGDGVELTKPENIRAAIASKAQLILDRYKGL